MDQCHNWASAVTEPAAVLRGNTLKKQCHIFPEASSLFTQRRGLTLSWCEVLIIFRTVLGHVVPGLYLKASMNRCSECDRDVSGGGGEEEKSSIAVLALSAPCSLSVLKKSMSAVVAIITAEAQKTCHLNGV